MGHRFVKLRVVGASLVTLALMALPVAASAAGSPQSSAPSTAATTPASGPSVSTGVIYSPASAPSAASAPGSPKTSAPSTAATTPAPAAPVSTGVIYSTASALSVDTATCVVFPGAPCTVYWHQSRGIATWTFYFSDGTSANGIQTCAATTCNKGATGYPNSAFRQALFVAVKAPNVSIYYIN